MNRVIHAIQDENEFEMLYLLNYIRKYISLRFSIHIIYFLFISLNFVLKEKNYVN